MEAQVTIGSTLEPNSGAILDLKEKTGAGVNSTRGLLMPRVALQKKNRLEPVVNGATTVNDKKAHTGLILFNTSTVELEKLCPGLYVWDSEQWIRLYDKCVDDSSDLTFSTNAINLDVDGFNTLNASEGIVEFPYTSSKAVDVSVADNWITISHDASNQTVKVDAVPNNAGNRTGTITLSDGIETKTISVIQEGLTFYTSASPSTIGSDGGTSTISVSKNSVRRGVITNSDSPSWTAISGASTLSPSIAIFSNTASDSRTVILSTILDQLSSSYGKAQQGTAISKQSTIVQDGLPPVPSTGRWQYSSTQGGVNVTDKLWEYMASGSTNIEIRCLETYIPSADEPLTYYNVQTGGGLTYTNMVVRDGPTGKYVTFSSISGPKNGSLTVTFLGRTNQRSYIFGIVIP